MAAGPSYDPSRIPYEVRLRYEVKNVVARHLRLTHFDDLWVELCHLKDQISKLESRIADIQQEREIMMSDGSLNSSVRRRTGPATRAKRTNSGLTRCLFGGRKQCKAL